MVTPKRIGHAELELHQIVRSETSGKQNVRLSPKPASWFDLTAGGLKPATRKRHTRAEEVAIRRLMLKKNWV